MAGEACPSLGSRRLHAVRQRRGAQRPPGAGGDPAHDPRTAAAAQGAGARDRMRTRRGAPRARRPPRARRADRAGYRRRPAGRSPDTGAQHVDVRDIPFEAARFDLVIDFGTCYHVSDTMDGRRAALREVARVLNPGRLFVHETRVAQCLAHPLRSFGRTLPWWALPSLARDRGAVLWGV